MARTFGLIDGNSFYCSCERAFAPRLRHLPVVVLSNNDGCAIARTPEAKALGVKMGDVYHLIQGKPGLEGVEWLSSNYALYGDMSRRMFQVLAERVPRVEPYSIDEMFLDLDGIENLDAVCRSLREDVRRLAKIPTCIGWGPTKTIAKLANRLAKTLATMGGVCDLTSPDVRQGFYRDIPVGDIWGIGAKTAAKLEQSGILNISDFVSMDAPDVRKRLTVVGARIHMELRGVSCLPLSEWAPTRKSIASSRSFGRAVTDWREMREAIAVYASRASEKLRAERLVAGHVAVFLQTNPHNGDPWHSGQKSAQIEPTNDSRDLIKEAVRLLEPLWRDGFRYVKAGVMLNDLSAQGRQFHSLFPSRDPVVSKKIMAAMDGVNARYGRGTLRPLATGVTTPWVARASHLSARYTTNPREMLVAKAW